MRKTTLVAAVDPASEMTRSSRQPRLLGLMDSGLECRRTMPLRHCFHLHQQKHAAVAVAVAVEQQQQQQQQKEALALSMGAAPAVTGPLRLD